MKPYIDDVVHINRYKLREDTTLDDILSIRGIKRGGTWVNKNSEYFISYGLTDEISVYVSFSEDISDWNDFDNILVLDEDAGQPYTPFYDYMEKETDPSAYLASLISVYNNSRSCFSMLEEIDEGN